MDSGWQPPHVKIPRLFPCDCDGPRVIELTVNGLPKAFAAPILVETLLADMQLVGKRVAVERNGEIVPRSHYADMLLLAGDKLEIVVAVGGG